MTDQIFDEDESPLVSAIESLEQELDAAVKHAASVSRRYTELSQRLSQAQQRTKELQTAIDTVRSITHPPEQERPSTASEFILHVLKEAGEPMQDQSIVDGMADEGWTTSSANALNLVRSHLSRLKTNGKVVRVERGVWDLTDSPSLQVVDIQEVLDEEVS